MNRDRNRRNKESKDGEWRPEESGSKYGEHDQNCGTGETSRLKKDWQQN